MSIFGKPKPSAESLRSLLRRPEAKLPAIDTEKRYDVYCRRDAGKLAVYKNARFKRRSTLLASESPRDFMAEWLELEQGNGKSVYLSRHSIVHFCEHGTIIDAEPVGEFPPPP